MTNWELIWEGSVRSVEQVVPEKWLIVVELTSSGLMAFSVPHEAHIGDWYKQYAERDLHPQNIYKTELLDAQNGKQLWEAVLKI